jgi:hypothetical protein
MAFSDRLVVHIGLALCIVIAIDIETPLEKFLESYESFVVVLDNSFVQHNGSLHQMQFFATVDGDH